MADINRFSSRRQRLDHAFLSDRLRDARSYKRIAGYFRSSIFELVGEEIAAIPEVRIVCNSELDAADVTVSQHVRETALKERWNEAPAEVEALLHRERYRQIYELLTSGHVEVRVVPKDRVFLHGKAGVIETADGSKTCFLGSINETKSAFAENYEILWEDTSLAGVAWVEEEFEALWQDSYPLPEAIVEEIKRVAERIEIRFEEASPGELPAAALAESPIYRGGEQLQPWQRSFVTMFLQHRETYGKARLLLADEVGVGKTLSLAASAMLSALLDDGPVLILCPSTLTLQWQVELKDKLGIPSAVWSSTQKLWIDANGHLIKTRGAEHIARCPYRIAIVSTGLIVQESEERQHLLARKFGTVVLDEAHKARRRGRLGETKGEPNNLLDFMLRLGPRTRNLLLGTATPIQTEVYELWDLMGILNAGTDAVLGREVFGRWSDWHRALPLVKGDETPADKRDAWEWLRNPLPPGSEEALFLNLRLQLGVPDQTFFTNRGFGSLAFNEQQAIGESLTPGFFKEHNPIVRHTVLRRRQTLEEAGLLDRVAVDIHPDPDATFSAYSGLGFRGLSLQTNHPFDLAYRAAEAFTAALQQRTKAAGLMKTLLLQRLCSSFASGRCTAEKLLRRHSLEEDEVPTTLLAEALSALTPEEARHLRTIVDELSRPEARDPKLAAVQYFLTEHRTEGKTWLEHGCIIFSQYYDTAYWIGSELARALPSEAVGVYAGVGKSGLFRGEDFAAVEREAIKTAVKRREIRLVVATDAACEGLNLQTLGTLINVDLPWTSGFVAISKSSIFSSMASKAASIWSGVPNSSTIRGRGLVFWISRRRSMTVAISRYCLSKCSSYPTSSRLDRSVRTRGVSTSLTSRSRISGREASHSTLRAPLFCHDGTERPIPHPYDATEQKACDRGKNKRHMLKNLLLIKRAWRMLFLSKTPPDRVHDKRLADTTPYPWPAGSQVRQDLGLQAVTRDRGEIIQPPQKPRGHELTRAPNAWNRKIARRRGRIEQVKSRVKRCRMLQETSWLWKAGVRDLLMAIGCALQNFRVRLTSSWALLV